MSRTLDQIYIANPITSNASTDLLYISQSPYTPGHDAGITYTNFAAQFATPTQTQESAFNYKAATGVNDAFVVVLSPAPVAYTDGLLISMDAGTLHNATTSPTLAVNALAAKAIVTYWGNPAIGDIAAHGTYIFIYNATNDNFELINPTISTANTNFVQFNSYTTATDSGSANAYAGTLTPPVTAINNSLQVNLIIAHANTTASTLTVNGLTKSIVLSNNAALTGGELVAGQNAFFIYSGTYDKFILINPAVVPLDGGGTGASLTASNGGIFYSTASAAAILSGTATAQQLLLSGASTTPQWSTTTYPLTNAINTIMYASSANVLGSIAAVNSAVLSSNGSGVPSMSTTLPSGIAATNMSLTTPTIKDSNGNNLLTFTTTASAVNYMTIVNRGTGNGPYITAAGSDSNIQLNFQCIGTATFNFLSSTLANWIVLYPAATTTPVIIGANGTDTNIGMSYQTKGTGVHTFENSAGNTIFNTTNVASAVNYINISPNSTGNPATITATGSDSNVGLTLATKGAGVVTAPAINATSINFGGSTLSNYVSETSWTPTFTFATPGNLSVVYAAQSGTYTRIGSVVFYTYLLICTPTFSTASGNFRLGGLPFTSNSDGANTPPGSILNGAGITYLGTLVPLVINNSTYLQLYANQSATGITALTTTAFTTTVAVTLIGSGFYFI